MRSAVANPWRDVHRQVRDSRVPYPRESTLHELFVERAAARPGAIAVVEGRTATTYRELAERADRVAADLLRAGLEPGGRVAVAAPGGSRLLVAYLGVLRAGGVYVPVDPAEPATRLGALLADSGVALSLVDRTTGVDLPDAAGPRSLSAAIAAEPWSGPWPTRRATDPAYLMFTSGSTGTPKGVLVPHRAVVRLVHGQRYLPFGPDLTFLQMAPVAFDASTLEVWGPLLHGGRMVRYPGELPVAAELARTIADGGVTTLWLTASVFNVVVDEDVRALAGARHVLFGGEAASVAHVRRARAALPGVRLINGYGPTEATTFTTTHEVVGPPGEAAIPIGRPLANTRVYLLDEAGEPVPAGQEAELHIGGDGVALGYLDDPDATTARFRPDPFVPGATMYRTGDWARRRPDGEIEFVGRRDGQVKLRGMRIELGEVEALLHADPAVRRCAAAVTGDGHARRLVAWTVAVDGADAAGIRARLAARAPAHLVPGEVVVVDRLPLLTSGKIDRRLLGDGWRRPTEGESS
ncbi:amino acid adenylation domain-containing protein [Micromonospora maritima]|uniref:amino acid adenylation domain-containing protein n=2 Tax=Micromonospora maritima TaxID=986711 RepID=UPI0031E6D911